MAIFTMSDRDEIIRVVREHLATVVWITEKGSIVKTPEEKNLLMLPKVGVHFFTGDSDFKDDKTPLMIIIPGILGIAATYPFWDGRKVFICGNPQCFHFGKIEDMDNHVHDNLWGQFSKGLSKRSCTKRRKKRG